MVTTVGVGVGTGVLVLRKAGGRRFRYVKKLFVAVDVM
jgi:hypothetical protein